MLDTFQKATPEALAAVQEEMRVRGTTKVCLVFAMGSQYDHLIMQKVARRGVYGLIANPATVTAEDVRVLAPAGVIISGGPASVHAEPPPFDSRIFDLGIPTLGICLGFQMWAAHCGAKVSRGSAQFSTHNITVTTRPIPALFSGCPVEMPVLQSHGDEVQGGGIQIHAVCGNVTAAAERGHLWGVQFHPECTETKFGTQIFENFLGNICGIRERFPAEDVAGRKVRELARLRESGARILLFLSGGSDSATCAYLAKAAGFDKGNLRGIYVKSVDRPDDELFVERCFGTVPWIDLKICDATERMLAALKGKTAMSEKRKAGFIPVYNQIGGEEAELWSDGGKHPVFVMQGTLYTDLSESGVGPTSGARKATIKVHHNTKNEFRSPRTGELFAEVTPLSDQVKDGGRSIGRAVGVPEVLLQRHPFPGPGGAVRIDGEVTGPKLAIERKADGIFIEELRARGLYSIVWQAGASLLRPGYGGAESVDEICASVCTKKPGEPFWAAWAVALHAEHTFTKGDDAGSGPIILIEADGEEHASALGIPWEKVDELQKRISNEVEGVGAVALRISEQADLSTAPIIMLWAVESVNGFTARHAELPWEFLDRVQERLVNEIPELGCVTYRVSNKPVSTIEIG